MSLLDEKAVTPPQGAERANLQHFLERSTLETEIAHTLVLDGNSIEVPTNVAQAVLDLLSRLSKGQSVLIGSVDEMLTTSQAGELLGISRNYVTQLVDRGDIPFEYRGTHRRIRLQDAIAYGNAARIARAKSLDEISKISKKAGLYAGDDF